MKVFSGMGQIPMMNPMMMPNPMMMQNPMMNNNQLLYQQQNKQMQSMMNPVSQEFVKSARLFRLQKEFDLCNSDSDLVDIGCTFGLVNEGNYNIWKVIIIGPRDSPYAGGVFSINIIFPPQYPSKGAEFRFTTKVYHLNVDFKRKETFGHICHSSLNEWATFGKVSSKPCYGVKQALFDIFCLFYIQNPNSAYYESMADEYKNRRAEFDTKAKEWTKKYATLESLIKV